MVLDIKNFITWVRSFLDDVYALKSDIPSGAILDNNVTQNSSNAVKSSGIYAALSGKANSSHSHSISNVTNLQSTLNDKIDEADLLNLIYPVGSIYMSADSSHETCPIQTWLGGTWVRIQDRFLLASTTQQGVGTTGGSADAVVVKHNHTQNSHTHTQGSHSHNAQSGAFMESNGAIAATDKRAMTHTSGNYYYIYSSAKNAYYRHTATGGATPTINGQTATNQESGVDGTGKNMPPYLVVNVWKRTA